MFGLVGAAVPFTAGPSFQQALMGQITSAASVADNSQTAKPSRRTPPHDTASDFISNAQDAEHTTYADEDLRHPALKRKMMTQTSRLSLPKNNASHDLAFFLRTTGPLEPTRKSSKRIPGRTALGSKNAFRFLRPGNRRHIAEEQKR